MALTSGNPMEISRHVQVPFDPAKTWHFHFLGRWTSWWPHEKQGCYLHSEFSFGSSSQFLPGKCSLCVLLVQVPVFFGGGQCSGLFVLYLIYSYICVIKRLVGNQTWQSIQHHGLTEKKTRVRPCESFTINISTVYACMYMYVILCISVSLSLSLSPLLILRSRTVIPMHDGLHQLSEGHCNIFDSRGNRNDKANLARYTNETCCLDQHRVSWWWSWVMTVFLIMMVWDQNCHPIWT